MARADYQREYYAKNKDRVAAAKREYRAKNKDRVAAEICQLATPRRCPQGHLCREWPCRSCQLTTARHANAVGSR